MANEPKSFVDMMDDMRRAAVDENPDWHKRFLYRKQNSKDDWVELPADLHWLEMLKMEFKFAPVIEDRRVRFERTLFEQPDHGTEVYMMALDNGPWYRTVKFNPDSTIDRIRYGRGILHATKEAAIDMAKAIHGGYATKHRIKE